jgi:sugar phosphate isomerase/epimerase
VQHCYAVSTHLYHDQRLARRHLEEIAAHGFDAIELFATRTHFDYHDPAAIETLGGWLKDTGLALHSMHAPISESLTGTRWGPAVTIAIADETLRRRAVDEATAALEVARTLPYHFLVVHLGQPDHWKPPPNDNRLDAARRSIETLHERAGAVGVRLALEVMPNGISTAESLVRFIEDDLELPDVGICMDFGHGFLMGDLVDAVETASGFLVTTHVHDNHGRTDDHLVPLDGAIDWASALMATEKIGYDGALVMEVANTAPTAHVLAGTQRARRQFDRMLGEGSLVRRLWSEVQGPAEG